MPLATAGFAVDSQLHGPLTSLVTLGSTLNFSRSVYMRTSLSQWDPQNFYVNGVPWSPTISGGTLGVMETVRSKHLGAMLRAQREAAQVKQQAACDQLGWSRSKLDRIEAGVNIPKQADLTAALDLYNADSETRGAMEELRKEAQAGRRGWWVAFGDAFRSSYPALEDAAKRIRSLETTLVPGLLQTPDYARAIIAAARPGDSSEAIDRRVQARMARQALLVRQSPPDVHVVIDEAVLYRQVGGPAVMDAQISALWAAGRRPNVTIQILPFEAGAHAGMDGPFVILNFDEATYPEVVFTGGAGGDVYLEGAADLGRFSLTWDRIATAALSPDDSARRCAELTRK